MIYPLLFFLPRLSKKKRREKTKEEREKDSSWLNTRNSNDPSNELSSINERILLLPFFSHPPRMTYSSATVIRGHRLSQPISSSSFYLWKRIRAILPIESGMIGDIVFQVRYRPFFPPYPIRTRVFVPLVEKR